MWIKNLVLIVLNISLSTFIFGQSETMAVVKILAPSVGVPIIKWDVDTTNLGDIDAGDIVEFDVSFTNVGDADLIIEVVTACKCIEIDYPRQPISPGEKGNIVVVFDSLGISPGRHRKTIDIIANTDPIVVEAFMKANILTKNSKK